MPFEGFDFTGFWETGMYADRFCCGRLTPSALADAEKALGYKLPASYVWLMERQNGGVPARNCFPTGTPTNWANDHIAVETIFGVGQEARSSIVQETRLMLQEWGYPDIGVAICDCPTAGHQEVFLDYRACGPQGEPQVAYIDQEDGFSITVLADNFEAFIRGLTDRSRFEPDDADE